MTDKKDFLELKYVPIHSLDLWEDNYKKHHIGQLIQSIIEHGFRDPPAYDTSLGAIVEGNGRTIALRTMYAEKMDTPKNIQVDSSGQWLMPVLFGVDASSKISAIRYGIDHNNITMGGDFTTWDVANLWDADQYIGLLEKLYLTDDLPVSVEIEDFQLLKDTQIKSVDQIPDDTSETMIGDDSSIDDSSVSEEIQSNGSKADRIINTDKGAILIINIANFNLVDDVYEAIEELLYANPGWDARITRN